MRRMVCTAALLLSIGLAAYAQLLSVTMDAEQGLIVMPKAGMSLSSMRIGSKQKGQTSSTAGMAGGIAFLFPLSEKIALQPEVLMIQKGGRHTYLADSTATFTAHIQMNYIELPVLLRIDVGSFYFNTGPSAGLLLGGSKTVNGHRKELMLGEETDEIRFEDFARQMGGGASLRAGRGRLHLDFRYGLGLSDLDNVAGPHHKTSNQTFLLSVGYAVALNVK